MKTTFLLLIIFCIIFSSSCAKKTCAAYNENQKEVYNMKKTKRSKARVY